MSEAEAMGGAPASRAAPGRLRRAWSGRSVARRPLAIVSWLGLALILLLALVGPFLIGADPLRQTDDAFAPLGTPGHLLGTDDLGRDMAARMVYGARPLLIVSLAATALATLLGGSAGLVAGYAGGRVDAVLMRVVDLAISFPSVLVIVLLVAGMGAGTPSLVLGIGIALAPGLARLARALAVRESGRDYVMSAELGGSRAPRIMVTEVLPNMSGPLLAQAVMTLSTAAGFAAGMSYIGMGIQPPTPDWGYMVAAGQEFLFNAPRLVVLPALATLLFVVACNFVGDDLRDALDPRSNR